MSWTEVSEALPPLNPAIPGESITVLVVAESSGHRFVSTGRHKPHGWYLGEAAFYRRAEVSHWQLFPELPERKGK